jgi:hypothetical protein
MDKIVNSEGDVNISSGDVKVDTTPQSEEERQLQEQAAKEMGVSPESVSDVVPDKVDEEITDEPEIKPSEEEQKENKEEASEFGYTNPEEKEPDALSSANEKIAKLQSDFEEFKTKTNEQLTQSQAEAIRLKNENDKLKGGEPTDKKAETDGMQKEFIDFCSSHLDVLGNEVIDDYKKFVASGNNAFIFNNPNLQAMAEAVEATNENLPFAKRLENAFKIAFADKIAETKSKQEVVKTEMKNQTIQKTAIGDIKSSSGNKSTYSDATIKIAEAWGVADKLP